MHYRRRTARCMVFAALAALWGCGGGGSPADTRPGQESPPVAEGPKSFLLFPNPQRQADGSLQMDTPEYAEAYYRAIDPQNARDTLAKWKATNGFETGTGSEINVVFGDRRDLGYGRRMYARQNPDGTVAFYVENYLIEAGAGYAYSPLNLDAAIVRDTRWMVGINAIEFSPGPGGGASFPKFYNFNPDGVRQLAVNLDGQGPKAMPGPCISCHGGRGDALTPPDATGKRQFALVQNSVSQHRGDVQARMHSFEPDVFDFSATRAGFSRAEQEASIKAINRMILCTYPIAAPSSAPEDACRRAAGTSEWQGTAAAVIKAAYGGDGLPNGQFVDDFVPLSWQAAGQTTLYREVVVTSCRTCHIMRGTAAQSDIDFHSYEKFVGYSERIKHHVIDRGNMPLAKIVYDAFWGSDRPQLLATFLQGQGQTVRDAAGAVLRPGRPVADPGPDRVVLPGATPLSASASLFANGYAWTLVSGPAGATLAGATSAQATFTASAEGTYVLQLVASNGGVQSAPAQVRIVVSAALSPAPAAIRFADIKAVMQGGNLCTRCHSPTGSEPRPPVFYSQDDRNGDGTVGDATDDLWFYNEVRGRINFTDIAASPLLRKPSGNHHNGLLVAGFNATAAPGEASRARYDLFLNWILNGAPQ
ncbi:MAG: PKD domain-containing protein [Pseudomonadota bacterium]|nr:PKD domain-containing protein [Pseudomonadota bacterium]